LTKWLSRLQPAEGWVTVGLVALTILTVVWSVVGSGWVEPLPDLGWIALAATLIGLLLAKIRVPSILLHPLALLIGVAMVVWQVCSVLPQDTWRERVINFALRLYAGGNAMVNGGISNDPLLFIVFLTGMTWLVAYVSAWFIFRWRRVIWALIPSGVSILVNLSYAAPSMAAYFGLYLLSAMLLVVRVNMFNQEQEWKRSQVRVGSEVRRVLYRDALGFSALVLLLAWFIPTAAASPAASDAWQWVTSPWQNVQTELNRVFGTIGSKGSGTTASFGRSMVLKGAISLQPRVIMTVRSSEPHYWRAVSYDEYTGHGWLTADSVSQPIDEVFAASPQKEYLQREEITQTFRLNEVRSNAFFTGGQPVKVSRPAQVDTEQQGVISLNVRDLLRGTVRQPELGGAVDIIRSTIRDNSQLLNQSDAIVNAINQRLPSDLRVTKATTSGGRGAVSDLELARVNEYPADVIALRSNVQLKSGDIYSVVSSVSTATEAQLRAAGTAYPTWVRERFLPLPSSLPERVGALAKSLTDSASNPYDKAVAIETYLRKLKYNENIKSPPPLADAVDYFLFTAPEGYCDYFSSAMVVMLRSVGIPARVAAGYVTGDYDSQRDAYVVRGTHAHSWVEAYFPQYGWIEFEPTPIRNRLVRPQGTPEAGTQTIQFPPTSAEPMDPLSGEFFPNEPVFGGLGGGITPPSGSRISLTFLLFVASAAVAGMLMWLFWRRGLVRLALIPQTYEKMCRVASLSNLAPRPTQTPEEYGSLLSRLLPESAANVQLIVSAYVRNQFGRKDSTGEEKASVQQAWRKLRPRLIWTLRWRKR